MHRSTLVYLSDALRCLRGLLFKPFICEQEITEATERANREGVFECSIQRGRSWELTLDVFFWLAGCLAKEFGASEFHLCDLWLILLVICDPF